jgi:enolase
MPGDRNRRYRQQIPPGSNAILGISLAVAFAAAAHQRQPLYAYLSGQHKPLLPVPMFNILNGGKHAAGSTDFQEFMVMPAGASSFSAALRMATEIYHALKKVLGRYKLNTTVGDEGGFAPALASNLAAIEIILEAITSARYEPGKDCFLALDIAASELFDNGKYQLTREGKSLSGEQMVDYYVNLIQSYPIISIEDGLDEDDWQGWQQLNSKAGNQVQLVGDDLYVTNIARLKRELNLRLQIPSL